MAVANPYNQYQEQSINTATPGMLIIMLFESAAKHINAGIRAVEEGNIQDSHNAIIKAQDIYSALSGCLDESVPMSKDLKDMYEYILKRLCEANIKKDAEILREVHAYTVEYRDTWKEAEKSIHLKK